MRIHRVVLLLPSLLLAVAGTRCMAKPHNVNSSPCSTAYENHNQIDYGPLKVEVIQGASDIRVGTQKQPGVPGACLVLFTEKDHKFVTSVKADADGRFELKGVAPGRYRLLARAEGFCTANIPIEVVRTSHSRKTEILVHFRPAGIDTCSYGELAPVPAKRAPTKR